MQGYCETPYSYKTRKFKYTERFSNWFERQLQYGFEKDIDFTGRKFFNTQAKWTKKNIEEIFEENQEYQRLDIVSNGNNTTEYILKLVLMTHLLELKQIQLL